MEFSENTHYRCYKKKVRVELGDCEDVIDNVFLMPRTKLDRFSKINVGFDHGDEIWLHARVCVLEFFHGSRDRVGALNYSSSPCQLLFLKQEADANSPIALNGLRISL